MSAGTLRTPWPLAMVILTVLLPADDSSARAEETRPQFEQLLVTLEPTGVFGSDRVEQLMIESSGRCWFGTYPKAKAVDPSCFGGGFDHRPSPARIERLNRLLKETQWLAVEIPKGHRPVVDDAMKFTIVLKRDGKSSSIVCDSHPPEPYASLLHELQGLALQERRVYLHDYTPGDEGRAAWQAIGSELASQRGEPQATCPFPIEHERYLPIAHRIVRGFYGQTDDELITAIRLVGQFQVKSELPFLHRMAHDRCPQVRAEVAWALGRCHNRESLPVLVSMMSTGGDWETGWELIRWGEEAVPEIVILIGQSTNPAMEERERTVGENMIRVYLEHWDKLPGPIDPRVVAAVREALESKDPQNGIIRIEYHQEFLKRVATEKSK